MNPTVLIISALGAPPYVGGIENVIDTLLKSNLAKKYNFAIFDTYRTPDPDRSIFTKAFFALSLFIRCAKHISSVKPELAHIHFCSKTDFWKHTLCLFACRIVGIKTIFHLHGGSFDSFYLHGTALQKFSIRCILARADILIALSQYWLDFLSRLVPNGNIRILPNPIDCATLSSFSSEISLKNHSVVLLGSLGKRKGHFDVLKAVPIVLASHPSTHFYFAGLDEDFGATEQLQKLAKNNNIIKNIHFLGPVSGEAKFKLLGEAGIIILPSYGENMPISVLEGMAAGKPVISTNVGAIPEVITNNENGILIKPGDWQALAQKINHLFDNPVIATQFGRRASKMALNHWDIGKISIIVDDLYKKMI